MDFVLFLMLNFTLFVRPADFLPPGQELPLYNVLILLTLAVAAPRVLDCLRPDRLAREPISVCVLALVPAIALSHLSHFNLYSARTGAWEFAKVVIYYLLLISIVNSTKRLRVFLYWVALFAAVNASIAVLNYYEFIKVPSLQLIMDNDIDPITGEAIRIGRLCGTGIFEDPNDLSMIAVFAIVVCTQALRDQKLGFFLRFAWLLPLEILFTALALTKSRGGIMAFVAAGGVLSYFAFGLRRTLLMGVLFLPAVALGFGGRQTDLSSGLSGGTGQSRVELWSAGLTALKRTPLFGIGFGGYADECGLVAHNSFVHCFVELGLLGGACYFGAFWFSVISLWKIGSTFSGPVRFFSTDLFRRWQPCVLAAVVGFIVSQMSLSRAYAVPTYLVLGTAQTYCLESRRQGVPSLVNFDARQVIQLAIASVVFLAVIYAVVIVLIR